MNSQLKDVRQIQRFSNFEKSYLNLNKAFEIENPSKVEKAGIIQFYEMAFELAWKVMKDYLEEQGYVVRSPREAIKQAFSFGLVDDAYEWIDALHDRNLMTHTYDEGTADRVVYSISCINPARMSFEQLLTQSLVIKNEFWVIDF